MQTEITLYVLFGLVWRTFRGIFPGFSVFVAVFLGTYCRLTDCANDRSAQKQIPTNRNHRCR